MGAVEPAVKVLGHSLQPPAPPRKHTPARSRPGTDHELHAASSNKQTADRGLRAGTRHEAANLCVAVAVVNGPHNGRAETVGLGYNCCVRHDQPLSIDAHTIVPIPGVPVDILHTKAVGKRTAQTISARETVEPRFER